MAKQSIRPQPAKKRKDDIDAVLIAAVRAPKARKLTAAQLKRARQGGIV